MKIKITALLLILGIPAFPAESPSKWLDFSLNPGQIQEVCEKIKTGAEAGLKKIAKNAPGKRTFENTAKAFEQTISEFNDAASGPTFLKYVSTDKAVRDAAHECEAKTESFLVDVYTREDIYKAIDGYAQTAPKLSFGDQRLLDRILLDFRRNGLALDKKNRAEVKKLKQRLVELEAAFSKNLNEHKDSLEVSRAELEGLPADYIVKLSTASGNKYRVTLAYPDYVPFMEEAKNGEARKALEFKFNNRAYPANIPLMEEALSLRHRIAQLMGYKTHAHYVLEDRMAKTPETVLAFLESLEAKLKPLAHKELKALKALKKAEKRPNAESMYAWEWRYFDTQLKKAKYQIDNQRVKEYFPLDVVTEGMLKIYQDLLGLTYEEVKPAYAWHPDIQQFAVKDKETGKLIGYFYMDLFPREGKYNHAAAFTLIKGRRLPDGSYQPPVSAMVANFNKPSPGIPSLLPHSEVETYFHEFGHIMHQVLTQAEYGRFSGTSVSRDFVEAPSQMLENWVWNAQVLESLSGHYKDKSKKLPSDLLARMIEAKNFNSGLRYLRQIFFAKLDLRYHMTDKLDTTAVYRDLMGSVSLIPMSEGTHPQASFGHLMGGYDAGYYGYLWSEVYSADMFSRFEKEGVLNPAVGLQYRRLILEPGRSVDEMGQLVKFLRRDPNDEAFLKSIGLKK